MSRFCSAGARDNLRLVALVSLSVILAVLWTVAFVAQVTLAWGFRGELKPTWFDVMTLAVYGAPVLLPSTYVIIVIARAALRARRASHAGRGPTPRRGVSPRAR